MYAWLDQQFEIAPTDVPDDSEKPVHPNSQS